jgi:hypothetical protein
LHQKMAQSRGWRLSVSANGGEPLDYVAEPLETCKIVDRAAEPFGMSKEEASAGVNRSAKTRNETDTSSLSTRFSTRMPS